MGHQLDTNFGEVSERFMELVLKTSDSERGRGFESHPLRQKERDEDPQWVHVNASGSEA